MNAKYIRFVLAAGAALLLVFTGCKSSESQLQPTGTFEATDVAIQPLVSGRVQSVKYAEGAVVNAGDTLAVIDTELLSLQKTQSEAQLTELRATLVALRAQLAQVESQYKNATTKEKRQTILLEAGTTSQQMYDDSRLQSNLYRLQSQALTAQIGANEAQQQRIGAAIAVTERQLRDGFVLSPVKATIIERNSEPGETVTPQTVMFKIADLSSLTLKIYISETEMSRIGLGKKLIVKPDAHGEKTFEGVVSFISPVAEFTPKNIQTKKSRADLVFAVKITVLNPAGNLHPGMPAEVLVP
ncbi:MAG: efflux RND transporter periplasmic adaptor subunit [bacterium]|nr:efflux RND transporter periplasmic adaptor subunit [bacterium]